MATAMETGTVMETVIDTEFVTQTPLTPETAMGSVMEKLLDFGFMPELTDVTTKVSLSTTEFMTTMTINF